MDEIRVFCDEPSHEGRVATVGYFTLGNIAEERVWDFGSNERTAQERREAGAWRAAFEKEHGRLAALRDALEAHQSVVEDDRVTSGGASGTVYIDVDGTVGDYPEDDDAYDRCRRKWVMRCPLCGLDVQTSPEAFYPLLDGLAGAGQGEVSLRFLVLARTRIT